MPDSSMCPHTCRCTRPGLLLAAGGVARLSALPTVLLRVTWTVLIVASSLSSSSVPTNSVLRLQCCPPTWGVSGHLTAGPSRGGPFLQVHLIQILRGGMFNASSSRQGNKPLESEPRGRWLSRPQSTARYACVGGPWPVMLAAAWVLVCPQSSGL